ncbi:MAG TPA: hypothetical protein VFJ06_11825 [Halococcus sp.]|nr:hypothetical protein [Halococcus sp.]
MTTHTHEDGGNSDGAFEQVESGDGGLVAGRSSRPNETTLTHERRT